MTRASRSAPVAFAAALACLMAAVLLRWLLDPILHDTLPVIHLFAAVMITVFFSGYRLALLVAALGYVVCAYLFIAPRGELGLPVARNVVGFVLYLATMGVVIGFGEALRRARRSHLADREVARQQAEQLNTTLESITDGFVRYDRNWRMVYVNAEAERINRLSRAEMLGRTIWEVFPAVVGTTLELELRRAAAERVTVEFENHYDPFGLWYSIKAYPAADGGLTTFIRDISDSKRSRALLASQARILEMVATETPLGEVLAAIAIAIEEQQDGLLCVLFVLNDDGTHIRVGVGPSMPEGSLARLEGLPIQPPYPEPCSMAMHEGEAVVVTDIEADARWSSAWRDQALAHGLRACRATPIMGDDGKPAGAFAMYRRETGEPAPADADVLPMAVNLTGIAIGRRKQQASLRASEARYRAIGESIDYGVWVCDAAGRNTYASESFLRLLGLTQHQFADLAWADLLHPDDVDATTAAWKECVQARAAWDRHHRLKGADGSWHDVLARGVPLTNDAGDFLGWVGINLDIARVQHAEKELVRLAAESDRQRRLYETVLKNTPDFMYVFSLDHKVLYANDALIEMWGRGHEGAIGKTFLEVGYEPWHAEMHDREIDEVRATRQSIRGEVPFSGTHGRRQYDYIFVPVIGADGEVEAVAGTTRDVTDRRANEERLRANDERQAFMVRLADAVRPLVDPVDVQAEAGRLLGEHLGVNRVVYFEVQGDNYVVERDYNVDVPSIVGRYPTASFGHEQLALYRAGKTAAETDVNLLPSRTQAEREMFAAIQIRACVGVPLVKGGVFVAGLAVHVASVRTWTPDEIVLIEETAERTWAAVERVRAEAAFRQSEARLVAQLRDADRRKDEFLATLAHELRNPLAPIQNGLQIMRHAEGREIVEHTRLMMERQLAQMVRLVDDLLDVSRVTSGKLELRRARVALRAVIDAAVETSRPVIDRARHDLEIVVPEQPIVLDGDPVRLAQIVSNLLNNAAKYTPEGGRIRLSADVDGDVAKLVVSDNGMGIPPDMLDKVFDMFTQVDRALEKTTGGLGLGLSLVKALTAMHDGTIEARSDGEGRGSEFVVRLPSQPEGTAHVPPPRAVEAPVDAAVRRRVLVADDNVDSAESLSDLLELLGNDVQTANDGLQALALAETSRPDVVLLDIGMPKLNGYDTCRRMREQPWSKNAIFVALTGWGQEDDRRQAREAGFDHHLVKPLNFAALEKLLASFTPPPG